MTLIKARPIILWVCAAILGTLAGINYAKFGSAKRPPASLASQVGFDSSEDLQVISKVVDTPKLVSVTPEEYRLLERYAKGPPSAAVFVAAALSNVQDEGTAQQLLPVARQVLVTLPNHPIALNLADAWKKNGCLAASKSLAAGIE